MADKAKHAFGALENVDAAIASGKIDSYDILFVKDANGTPYVGWVDKNGNKVICDNQTDISGVEAELATKANAEDVEALESQIATKVDAEEVDVKVGKAVTDSIAYANAYTDKMVEAAMSEHLTKKYEITSVPDGTLVDYRENEIRVMCPVDAKFTKQAVGTGGDVNSYYMTFKTYVPSDDVVGYIEHMNGQSDNEILTKLSVDEYGRRYQPTWLALATYNEATDTWTYYGANSTANKYIGWNYQIDWYDANGVMIASDCVRINLSNENCHSAIKPYYGVSETEEIETKVEEVVEEKMGTKVEEAVATSNAYTDAQIEAKISEAASAYEIIEF